MHPDSSGKMMQPPGAVDGCGLIAVVFLVLFVGVVLFLTIGGIARSYEGQPRAPAAVTTDYGVPICANYGDPRTGDAWGRTVTRYGAGNQVVSVTTEAHTSC